MRGEEYKCRIVKMHLNLRAVTLYYICVCVYTNANIYASYTFKPHSSHKTKSITDSHTEREKNPIIIQKIVIRPQKKRAEEQKNKLKKNCKNNQKNN